jgi:hypothetical protein
MPANLDVVLGSGTQCNSLHFRSKICDTAHIYWHFSARNKVNCNLWVKKDCKSMKIIYNTWLMVSQFDVLRVNYIVIG